MILAVNTMALCFDALVDLVANYIREGVTAMRSVGNGLHLLWVSVNLAATFFASAVISYVLLQTLLPS